MFIGCAYERKSLVILYVILLLNNVFGVCGQFLPFNVHLRISLELIIRNAWHRQYAVFCNLIAKCGTGQTQNTRRVLDRFRYDVEQAVFQNKRDFEPEIPVEVKSKIRFHLSSSIRVLWTVFSPAFWMNFCAEAMQKRNLSCAIRFCHIVDAVYNPFSAEILKS